MRLSSLLMFMVCVGLAVGAVLVLMIAVRSFAAAGGGLV